MSLDDPHVGRDTIPSCQQDGVAHYDLGGVDINVGTVAYHRHLERKQFAQTFGSVLGPVLLHESEQSVHRYDGEDGDP